MIDFFLALFGHVTQAQETRSEMPAMPVPPPWAVPDDRRTLTDLIPLLIALALFSLFGGTTKLLARWNPTESWQRKLGGVMGSVLAGCCVGIPVSYYPWMSDKQGLVIVAACVGSWGGLEFVDRLTRRLERTAERYLPPTAREQS